MPTYDLAKTSLIGKLTPNCTNGWPLLTVKLFTRHGSSAVRIDKIILIDVRPFIVLLCVPLSISDTSAEPVLMD